MVLRKNHAMAVEWFAGHHLAHVKGDVEVKRVFGLFLGHLLGNRKFHKLDAALAQGVAEILQLRKRKVYLVRRIVEQHELQRRAVRIHDKVGQAVQPDIFAIHKNMGYGDPLPQVKMSAFIS